MTRVPARSSAPPPVHLCHAKGCQVAVPEAMFMCRGHWYMVPKRWRDRVWEVYVPGQEQRKDPSPEYVEVATQVIALVGALETAAAS